MNHWLDSLNAHGIQRINGRLIADASELAMGVPDGWDWSDGDTTALVLQELTILTIP